MQTGKERIKQGEEKMKLEVTKEQLDLIKQALVTYGADLITASVKIPNTYLKREASKIADSTYRLVDIVESAMGVPLSVDDEIRIILARNSVAGNDFIDAIRYYRAETGSSL